MIVEKHSIKYSVVKIPNMKFKHKNYCMRVAPQNNKNKLMWSIFFIHLFFCLGFIDYFFEILDVSETKWTICITKKQIKFYSVEKCFYAQELKSFNLYKPY